MSFFYGLTRLQSAKFSLIRVAPVTAKERTWGSVRAALGVAIHEMPWMPFAVRWSRINQHPTGGQAFCMQTAKIFSEFCDYKQARDLHGSWKMEPTRQYPPFPERATSTPSPSPVLKQNGNLTDIRTNFLRALVPRCPLEDHIAAAGVSVPVSSAPGPIDSSIDNTYASIATSIKPTTVHVRQSLCQADFG